MKIRELKSLGLKSDLEIARFENKITERDGYIVVETPGNPHYYWGNFLVFPNPPTEADRQQWPEIFRKEFGHNPLIRHQAFTWDSPSGKQGVDFPGYVFEASPIYHLNKVTRPKHLNQEVEVRALKSDADWEMAIHNQVACRHPSFDEAKYYDFKRPQMARYRRMANLGYGNWFGAFLQKELVADAGIFHFNGIGRFQVVGTAPAHRKKGIAAALIHHMAVEGLKISPTLVIIADPTHGADRVYRSVGFGGNEIAVQLAFHPSSP